MTSDPRVGLFFAAAEAFGDFWAAAEASNSTYVKFAKPGKSRNYQKSIFMLRPMTSDPRVGLFSRQPRHSAIVGRQPKHQTLRT